MRSLVAALVLLACVSCSVDQSAEQDVVLDELPTVDGTQQLSIERSTYCSSDSCLLGDDAMTSTYTFAVDPSGPTELELIDAYVAAIPEGADVRICEMLDTDPAGCVSEDDNRASASFLVGGWFVHVNTLTWDEGTYTISVSAVIE